MKRLWIAMLLFACAPAMAQFDLNRMLDLGKKALDTGKKLNEASREFTTDEEIQLGDGVTAAFLGAAPLHPDANVQRYVNRVGKWVALHSDRPELPWSFGVIDTEAVNAFAMPGGSVLISHGLLKRLGNEAELAGVLGHEIAHVVRKHQLAAIQSSAGTEVFADIGKEAIAQRTGRNDVLGLRTAAAKAGVDAVKNGVFLRPLDRTMEYEADRLGVVIAARSGYDPYGLVAALQMLAQLKPEETGISIMFSTHPAPTDRLAELEKFAPVLEKYATQPQVESRFRQSVR
jgi:beta-barrel assembly-enhancing protease